MELVSKENKQKKRRGVFVETHGGFGSFVRIPYFDRVEYRDLRVLLRFGGGGLSIMSFGPTAVSRT